MDNSLLQLNTMDAYLSGQQKIPLFLDGGLTQTIISKPHSLADLQSAKTELLRALDQLEKGLQPEKLQVSPHTESIVKFSQFIQPKLIAAETVNAGDSESIRATILLAIQQLLDCVAAVQLTLELTPRAQPKVEQIIDHYNRRCAVHQFLLFWTDYLLHASIEKKPAQEDAVRQYWNPLSSLHRMSASELVRYLIRATVVDGQVDNEVDSLLYQLTKGVHLEWSPQVSPEQLLWRRENDMLEWVSSQTTRDRVGAQFAPYLAKLLNGTAEAYDPEFHAAFNAMLQAIQLYYQSLPATAAAQSTTGASAPAPAATPPAPASTPQQIPVSTPATAQPTPIITPTTTESVPVPGATVDLRTAQPTPPTPPNQPAPAASQTTDQPPVDQPRIKPLNLP